MVKNMESLAVLTQGMNPELRRKAREELGETPDVQTKAVLELRKLINDEPDFYCLEDNTFFIRFLRTKKYDVKKAFHTLQNYYAVKAKFPGVVTEPVRRTLDMGHILIPPKRTPRGDIVLILNSGRMNLDVCTPEDVYNASTMCLEALIDSDANQICRFHLIVDLKEITLKKLKQFTSPSFIALIINSFENCSPFRLGSLNIVNAPFYFSLPYKIIYHMISEKHQKRIRVIGGNMSELHKIYPAGMLPETLGGTMTQQTYMDFKNTIINKHLEIERVKKYSFHRQSKPVKKHSTCGLQENASFLQNNNSTGFQQSEVTN